MWRQFHADADAADSVSSTVTSPRYIENVRIAWVLCTALYNVRYDMKCRPNSILPRCKGGLKNAKRPFPSKIALRVKKVYYKVSLCENCQRQSCKTFIGLYPCKDDWWGRPLLLEILVQTDCVGAKSPIFLYIFARSPSAATPGEQVQLALIGSPLRAFQWAQDEHRTWSLSSKEALKNTVSNIWIISCDNSETVRGWWCS